MASSALVDGLADSMTTSTSKVSVNGGANINVLYLVHVPIYTILRFRDQGLSLGENTKENTKKIVIYNAFNICRLIQEVICTN